MSTTEKSTSTVSPTSATRNDIEEHLIRCIQHMVVYIERFHPRYLDIFLSLNVSACMLPYIRPS